MSLKTISAMLSQSIPLVGNGELILNPINGELLAKKLLEALEFLLAEMGVTRRIYVR